jgi:hypothetical protein
VAVGSVVVSEAAVEEDVLISNPNHYKPLEGLTLPTVGNDALNPVGDDSCTHDCIRWVYQIGAALPKPGIAHFSGLGVDKLPAIDDNATEVTDRPTVRSAVIVQVLPVICQTFE